MKRIIAFLITSLMLLSGCGNKDNVSSTKDIKETELNIVCTVFPSYDFAREIVGDKGEVTLLLPPNAESHSFSPTLSDIALIEECDLFIYVGGEIDPWAADVIENSNNTDRINLSLLDVIGVDEHTHDDGHASITITDFTKVADEHVWTSISNSIKIVNSIADTLVKIDKTNEITYSLTKAEYVNKLTELKSEFQKTVDEAARDTLVFADRFPFYWFGKEFSLKSVAALDGCSSDTEPTLTQLKTVIDEVTENNIPVVLYIESSSGKIADKVVAETGAKKQLFHSCHNVSKEELDKGESYFSLMQKNLVVLKEALG